MKHVIDAKGQILGRLASQVASILQGKTHPSYEPNKSGQTAVIIKNASKIKVSGRKYNNKIYYNHTGYMGHLKTKTYSQIFEKSPERIIEMAIRNMLPKNRLQKDRMKRLIIER
jgi:large subunit ribosomal protein L13